MVTKQWRVQVFRKGGEGGGGYPDPEIRWGPGVQKVFFRPFGPQFSLKISGGPGPPRPLPWIRLCQVKLKLGTFYPLTLKAGSKYAYITLARKNKPNNQTNKPHSSHLGCLPNEGLRGIHPFVFS